MREVLVDIVKRLGEIPAASGELVRKRAETSDALHKALDALKQREVEVAGVVAAEKNGDGKPAFPNEASRAAEALRRLQADAAYQGAKAEADRLRGELRELDARIEGVGQRHRSDCQVAYLVASLLANGLQDDAKAVLEAYAQASSQEAPAQEAQSAPAPAQPQPVPAGNGKGGDGLETGTFKVLEVRPGKSDGTIRAYCEGPDGKVAVYAKNGEGKALAGAVGGKVELKFRRVDRGLFAVSVRPVA